MSLNAIEFGAALQSEFALEERLGGEVYRARRRRDGRELAVRVVRPSTPLLAAEFMALAESASHIRHPTLAGVEAYGQSGPDTYYIASEYVRGQKLDAWADDIGIPPLAQVIELVRRLCIGLQAAARGGLAHDAVNPRNVRVLGASKGSGTRTPMKLLDLGVPVLLFNHAEDPHAVRFMAPEQLKALMRPELPATFRCSETMNVYSCGSLLYFLATGGPPHPGSAPSELLASQAAGRLAPPARINPQISPGLNAVVLRALAIDPSERYASVAELGEALASVAGTLPSQGRTSSVSSLQFKAISLPLPPPAAEPRSEEPPSFDSPTFKTSRLAVEQALERRAQAEPNATNDVPTVPPPSAAAAVQQLLGPEARDSVSGVAPIGLFSSAPPFEERRAPLSSIPPGEPPLALFSQPPGMASAAEEPVDLAAEGVRLPPLLEGDRISNTPSAPYPDPYRRRGGQRSVFKVALPLAAAACLLAFVTVRGLLVSEDESAPLSTLESGDHQRVAAQPPVAATLPAPAPVPLAKPTLPETQQPAAIVAPAMPEVEAPEAEPSAFPEAYDPGLLAAAQQQAARGRDREHTHRGQRPHGANAEASAKEDPALQIPEPVIAVHVQPADPTPPAPESSETAAEAPAAVVHVKPVPAAAADTNASSSPAETAPPPRATTATPRAAMPASSLAPAPAPTPTTPPAQALRADVAISSVTVRGSLPTSLVRRAVERIRPQFAACYAQAAQVAGHNGFGELIVDVQIDERGRARSPHVQGGTLPRLDACVAEATTKLISEKAPDTGTVNASWKVAFTP